MGISFPSRFFVDESVAVAADYQVHIPCLRDEGEVVEGTLDAEADVGQGDHQVAFLLILEVCGPFVHGLQGLQGGYPVRDLAGDHGADVAEHSDDAYLPAGFLQDGVRSDVLARLEGREVIIGADHGAFQARQAPAEILDAVVELMVSQGDAVITHGIDGVYLQVAVEHGEIGRTL